MSLFKRVHTVTVPAEFLDKGDPVTTLRFSQLNPKKMDKANLADTHAAFSRQKDIEAGLDEKQRAAWDAKAKQRILKDHRVSIELVERVMAELLDDSQTHEDGL